MERGSSGFLHRRYPSDPWRSLGRFQERLHRRCHPPAHRGRLHHRHLSRHATSIHGAAGRDGEAQEHDRGTENGLHAEHVEHRV